MGSKCHAVQVLTAQSRLIALFLKEALYQWRPDETRMNGVDADIVFSVKQCIYLGHDPVGSLCGMIGRKVRSTYDAVDGGDVNDIPAFLPLHIRHNILGAEKGSSDIDIEDPLPFSTSILVSGLVGTCHACIVHQDVYSAIIFIDGFGYLFNPLLIGHIQGVVLRPSSRTVDSLYYFFPSSLLLPVIMDTAPSFASTLAMASPIP